MKRILSIGGFILLVVGLILLYTAFIAKPDITTVDLGASIQTVQEVAAAGGEVEVIADGGSTTAENVGGEASVQTDDVIEAAEKPSGDDDSKGETPEISESDIKEQAKDVLDTTAFVDGENPVENNQVITEDSNVTVVGITSNLTPDPDGTGGGGTLAQFEQRLVELEYPQVFREGEAGAVRITLKALDNGQTQAVAEIEGNTVLTTPVLLTQWYGTHDAFVTANMVAPDFEVEESNPRRQQMLQGSEVSWRWVLKPTDTGNFIITFSVQVMWEPKPGSPDQEPKGPYFVAGNSVQTRVDKVFGLISIPETSIAGTLLALIGAISQIPGVMAIYTAYMERKAREVREGKKKSSRKRSRR